MPGRLAASRQTGARGIVTSLHDIAYGEVWSVAAIEERKALIADDASLGLRWSVVESLPIHERIKLNEGDQTALFDNYRASMRNLAACGVKTICYNFMPVLDWTRTELAWPTPGGGRALRFGIVEFAAFDCYMLERPGAEAEYAQTTWRPRRPGRSAPPNPTRPGSCPTSWRGCPALMIATIFPACAACSTAIAGSRRPLRENLARFLREIIPLAEELGMRFAIHPDDPPRPLMGLPRIVSNAEDLAFILGAVEGG